jgi:hypothetical protein
MRWSDNYRLAALELLNIAVKPGALEPVGKVSYVALV